LASDAINSDLNHKSVPLIISDGCMNNLSFPQLDSRLSSRQVQAVEMVLQERNDKDIADAIGVRRETVNNWRNHNDAFRDAVEARLEASKRLETAKVLLSTVITALQSSLMPGTENMLLEDLPILVDIAKTMP
jgi:FixJ family two-component response regulator